jgi:hypothetical protein
LWRLGRRMKDDVNSDFIEIEGEIFGELCVDGRII